MIFENFKAEITSMSQSLSGKAISSVEPYCLDGDHHIKINLTDGSSVIIAPFAEWQAQHCGLFTQVTLQGLPLKL